MTRLADDLLVQAAELREKAHSANRAINDARKAGADWTHYQAALQRLCEATAVHLGSTWHVIDGLEKMAELAAEDAKAKEAGEKAND